MNNNQEKREYKRIDKPFIMNVRVKPEEAKEAAYEDWDLVDVKNLGAGGVYFYYNKDLEVGSVVDLKIDLSEFTSPITCAGKAIRIKKHQRSSIYDVVIEFTEIDGQVKDAINKAVEESHR